ncbi:MAG TPA: flagellar basal body rod protein FlgC [Acidobacteriota bacterium]|nr:flagellar basal body rod protein FlgC [Acidobacteriota bacterium]
MSLNTSIEIASSGMSAQRRRLEVIAANMANAHTTRTAEGGPYRKKLIVFSAAELDKLNGDFAGEFRRQVRKVQIDRVVDDPRPPLEVFDPSHPDADQFGYVRMPNINVVEEMVNMIGAARSYEANLEVVKTSKRMSVAALELGNA